MVAPLSAEDLGLEQDIEFIGVLDLPQLYERPTYASLIDTLAELKSEPSSLGSTPKSGTPRSISGASTPFKRQRKIRNEGVSGYLTKIVSSRLAWIEDEAEKEELWNAASQVLSERSGRTAMGDLTRSFRFAKSPDDEDEVIKLSIYEPALTGDSLGHKTWTSSVLLAQRLSSLVDQLPSLHKPEPVLELGSGTGIVGMAAACVFARHVVLTDLPEIRSNLEHNTQANAQTILERGGSTTVSVLDWNDVDLWSIDAVDDQSVSFSLVLAADVVYSMDHPGLLAGVLEKLLARRDDSRVIIELPRRHGYHAELEQVRVAFDAIGLRVVDEGTEVGYDDWSARADEPLEVSCWWSIWMWKETSMHT